MNKLIPLGAAALLALPALAQDQSAVIQQMQKQIQELQQQVETLKEGPPRDKEADDLMGRDFFKAKGLSFGFYGESKYRFPKNGANTFDAHRYVLLPSYQIADWLVFNSEVEIEHGGSDEKFEPKRSRFDGEVEIEQFYVDILIHEHFNVRSLGIDLVPMGRINLYHEPTLFYSTERPELYREIIPSTWMEPSMSVFGKIIEGLDYQFMVSAGLEDSISKSSEPGLTAKDGIREARPRLRRADENNLAYSGRLHYSGLPGLDASASFYVTDVKGLSGKSTVFGWDIEALYRVPKTGLELRGEFAQWRFDKPEVFVANNDADLKNDIGDEMYGWYVEAAYHLWPKGWRVGRGSEMDLVPFIRYTEIVTQSGLANGVAAQTDGSTNKEYLTAGLSYFLNANFVVKGDYRHNLKNSNDDYFQIGVGMFF